jgi:uncharacterized phage protein (TIGR01671 family)
MRDFEFRVWDKERRGFLSCINDRLRFGCDSIVTIPVDSRKNFAIQQFTGLFDKNGKKIFEGDIVRVKMGNRRNLVTEVIYTGGQFSPFPLSDDCRSKVDDAEVVGNIFENGDLIK